MAIVLVYNMAAGGRLEFVIRTIVIFHCFFDNLIC